MTFEEYVERSAIWVWDLIGYTRSQSVRMGEDALTACSPIEREHEMEWFECC